MLQKPLLYILVELPLSSRDQVCDYVFIHLRLPIYTHVKSTLFWILKYRNQNFWLAVWFQLGQGSVAAVALSGAASSGASSMQAGS